MLTHHHDDAVSSTVNRHACHATQLVGTHALSHDWLAAARTPFNTAGTHALYDALLRTQSSCYHLVMKNDT
jgi:hypothetical protein